MARAIVTLGRFGIGPKGDNTEYDAWVAYVSEHIDTRCGFVVEVESSNPRDVQEDRVRLLRLSDDEDTKQVVVDAIRAIWNDFCDETCPWPKKETVQ